MGTAITWYGSSILESASTRLAAYHRVRRESEESEESEGSKRSVERGEARAIWWET